VVERLVLSQAEAAKALGVSERTLERWRVEGRGPRFVKLGKRVGYTEADLRAKVDASLRQSTSDKGAAA
jgi:predicted DNA-binding transcriptional regulator AlpA